MATVLRTYLVQIELHVKLEEGEDGKMPEPLYPALAERITREVQAGGLHARCIRGAEQIQRVTEIR